MTSGQFNSVLLDSIVIKRDERQRRELTHVDELALSIKQRGLIHPPVITREHILVVGERRVAACRMLGWTHIAIQWIDELSPKELEAIEYEENVKRVDIKWQEKVHFVNRYHEMHLEDDPTWTFQKTGERLGYSKQAVNDYLQVAEATKTQPALLEIAEFSTVRGNVERQNQRKRDLEEEAFEKLLPGPTIVEKPPTEDILCENFLEWAPAYRGPKFNFLHIDFPYGIGADKFNQGGADAHGGYADTKEHYIELIYCLLENLDRIASESAHLMFWFSMEHYEETLTLLRTRFSVSAFPLVWMKTDNSGIIPDPQRGPRRIYETAFFAARGDRKIVKAVSNAYGAPSVKDAHMSEKSESMLRYFFGMIVDKFTTMLDPTCGSGSALRAAESLEASRVLGLEISQEFVDRALLKLRQARKLRVQSSELTS